MQSALGISARRRIGTTRTGLEAERRALETFRPGAYVAAERERTGLLLDRATRALQGRLATDRALLTRSSDRLPALSQGTDRRRPSRADSQPRRARCAQPLRHP